MHSMQRWLRSTSAASRDDNFGLTGTGCLL
jgi:hypothetical protein